MTPWARPEWLAKALENVDVPPVPPPDRQEWPIRLRAGDIRAARAMDGESGARLVLVTGLNEEDHTWVNTMLLSNVIEVSTSKDVRLDPGQTYLPFQVLVETDIVGPMFVGQFGPRLGTVDDEMLATLQIVKRGDDLDVLAGRRGLPIRSRKEPRASWKDNELQAMHDLAGECFARLVLEEAKEEILVDPALFEEFGNGGDLAALLRVVDLLTKEGQELELPEEAVLAGGGGIRGWLRQLGPDQWKAIEPVIQQVLTSAPVQSIDTVLDWRPGREANDQILRRRIAARAARGDRSVKVATKASFWKSKDLAGSVLVAELEGMGIVQVEPELVETAA